MKGERVNKYDYEERLIAFIDILGFKEAISENNAEVLIKTIQLIKTTAEDKPYVMERENYSVFLAGPVDANTSNQFYAKREISMFSDLIVISYGIQNEADSLRHLHKLLHTIYFIQEHLTSNSMLIRGGVTYGQLYHKNDICVGPALIKAYELESKEAIYPRVILDPELLKDRRYKRIIRRWPCYLEQYKDNYYFVTHFAPLRTFFDIYPDDHLEQQVRTRRIYIIQILYAYKVAIERALNSNKPKVQEKGKWLEEQYNGVLKYFRSFYDFSDKEEGYVKIYK